MSVYIDRKFLGAVSHRLERFSQKNADLYNFRCPLCGDSRKNQLKARGFVYRKGNDYFYRCHNCGVGISFSNFLKQVDANTHREYVLERYSAGENKHSNYTKPNFDDLRGNAYAKFASTKNIFSPSIKSIDNLEESHPARLYIQERMIPESKWSGIYFTEAFKDFLDHDYPDHGKQNVPNDARIVLFYRDEGGAVTNIAGRALDSAATIRYMTIKLVDGRKAFGLESIDKSKRMFLVEGQFDSMFLPNGIASGDSALTNCAANIEADDLVLVWDNEPRNKEIVALLGDAIDKNYKVVIWPTGLVGKDINEMVLNGTDVSDIIDSRVFSGAAARVEFIKWKRC
jgi:hypothetical protein